MARPNWRGAMLLGAMSSNQGIQAFVVTVPEPSTASFAILAGGLFLLGALHRKKA